MNIQKMIDSGVYLIEKVVNAEVTEHFELGVTFNVRFRESRDRYESTAKMMISTRSDLIHLLARGKTEITLDELCNNLVGVKHMQLESADEAIKDPDIDIWQDDLLYLHFGPDFVSECFHDNNRAVEVDNSSLDTFTELLEYFPTKPFSNFSEEKEFRKEYGRNRVSGWKYASVEKDIKDVVRKFNDLPFVYTSGWSCSGTFKDNGHLLNQGYITFRADETNPLYTGFTEQMRRIPSVTISKKEADQWDSNILTVNVDPRTHRDPDAYRESLLNKWNSVLRVINNCQEEVGASSLGRLEEIGV